jgi:hypothetical protein
MSDAGLIELIGILGTSIGVIVFVTKWILAHATKIQNQNYEIEKFLLKQITEATDALITTKESINTLTNSMHEHDSATVKIHALMIKELRIIIKNQCTIFEGVKNNVTDGKIDIR